MGSRWKVPLEQAAWHGGRLQLDRLLKDSEDTLRETGPAGRSRTQHSSEPQSAPRVQRWRRWEGAAGSEASSDLPRANARNC